MEILPKGISKADGVEEVCNITGISRENTFGIGNDFNDLELLDFTKHSYVVDNAPGVLKKKYKTSRAHHENGFTHAIKNHFDH
jgi:hydroxymethylpyrimidine pyrophosphatase-like HAD family hydrolase